MKELKTKKIWDKVGVGKQVLTSRLLLSGTRIETGY